MIHYNTLFCNILKLISFFSFNFEPLLSPFLVLPFTLLVLSIQYHTSHCVKHIHISKLRSASLVGKIHHVYSNSNSKHKSPLASNLYALKMHQVLLEKIKIEHPDPRQTANSSL